MAHTFTQLYFHIVFSTKNREPLILSTWKPDLYAYLGGIVRNRRGELIAAGGMPDHLHLLVRLPAALAVADAVRDIKAVSSGWRHDNSDPSFAWQGGYGAFSVSHSQIDTVQRYVDRQEEHHRIRTFQQEFIAMLERHGIEYDSRYIWD